MRRITSLLLVLVAVAAAAGAVEDFTFVVLGDRTGGHVEGIYGTVVEKSLAEGADLYITVGDQIEGYTDDADAVQEEWDEYFGIVERIPTDLYLLAGNHDIWDDQSEEIWRERVGTEPNYSFDYQGVHFTMLDTSRWEASDSLPEEYYRWLEVDLSAHSDDRLTLVFFHKPLWYDTLAGGEADRLHEIFKAGGVDGIFNGHFHTYGSAFYDGIAYTMVGSSGGRMSDELMYKGHFFQYCVVDVSGDNFEITVVPLEGDERLTHDCVSVSDLKFFDKVEEEYIVMGECFEDKMVREEGGFLTVSITNIYEEPFVTEIRWDTEGTDWEVEPSNIEVEIPGGGVEVPSFTVKYEGEIYPLPTVHIRYPWGEGKLYDYEFFAHITRTLKIPSGSAPQIDGNLGDGEWAESAIVDYFCSPEGEKMTIEDTVFYFTYDNENLYIRADCEQESDFVVNATERDGAVWMDDCVGFFLSPGGLEGDIYQIYFNPDGVIFDQRIFTNEQGYLDGEVEWNVDCLVATDRGDTRWSIEIAIPFLALKTETPRPGDEWRINFRRKEPSLGSTADWQYPISYDVNYFGRAVFGE